MKTHASFLQNALYFSAALIFLIPWVLFQYQVSISGDTSFLMFSAEKLLNGMKMSEHYYDNNPPLSFLIYIPAVILKNTGLSPHNAVQLYTGAMIIIASLTTFLLIQKTESLSTNVKAIAPIAVLFICTTLFLTEFSLKDHFITLALFPFICAQYIVNKNTQKQPRFLIIFTFIFFGIFLFVKPHYGIIPIYMIAHRSFKKRTLKLIFKSDFWILSALAIIYTLYVIVIMPDYISEVFTTSIDLYAFSSPMRNILTQTVAFAVIAGLCVMLTLPDKQPPNNQKAYENDHNLIHHFAVISLLAIIPFYIQNKGFYGHFLPALSLLIFTIILLGSHHAKALFEKEKQHILIVALAITVTFHLALIIPNSTSGKIEFSETKSSFMDVINKHAPNKTVFVETYSTHLFWKHKIYNEIGISSRFPSLWFLSDFAKFDQKKQYAIWLKFGNMMAKDLERKTPDILILLEPKTKDGGFYNVFKNHPELGTHLQKYSAINETLSINKDTFGILRKIDDPEMQNYIIFKRKEI